MVRLLTIVAIVAAALWLLFGRRRRDRATDDARPASNDVAPPAEMVACAHCGVHLPRGDAVPGAGRLHFCSEAHRDAGPR